MAQLFGIELVTSINETLSKTEIEGKLDTLAGKLKPLEVKLDIDNKTLNTISEFNKSLKDLEKTANKIKSAPLGKNLTQEIPTKKLKEIGKEFPKLQQSIEKQGKSLQSLGKGYSLVNKEMTELDSKGKELKKTLELVDSSGLNTRTVSMDLVTGDTKYKDTENQLKGRNQVEQSIKREQSELTKVNRLRQQSISQVEKLRASNKLTNAEADKKVQLIQRANSAQEILNNKQRLETQLNKQTTEEIRKQLQAQYEQAKHRASMAVDGLAGKIDPKHSKQMRETVDSMGRLNPDIDPNAIKRSNELNQSLSRQIQVVRAADQGWARFNRQLASAMLRVPIYAAVMAGLYAPLNAVKDAIQQIIEIDTQMTVLERVSNGTIVASEAMEDSTKIAERLGNTIAEVNEGLINFARQGFRGADLTAITEVATVMSNVSDLGVEDAASSLTAAMKAFNIEAENSIRVVDALNEVDKQNCPLYQEWYEQTLNMLENRLTALSSSLFEKLNKHLKISRTWWQSAEISLSSSEYGKLSETTKRYPMWIMV